MKHVLKTSPLLNDGDREVITAFFKHCTDQSASPRTSASIPLPLMSVADENDEISILCNSAWQGDTLLQLNLKEWTYQQVRRCNRAHEHLVAQMLEVAHAHPQQQIHLLKNKQVLQWIVGDLSFLPGPEPPDPQHVHLTKTAAQKHFYGQEVKWGQALMKAYRPDIHAWDEKNNWTTIFGQDIVKELMYLKGKNVVQKPKAKEGKEPDWEVEDEIIEVKNQTYFCGGTAPEKIAGVPLKYADVPQLWNKRVNIICVGGAEQACRNDLGILSGPALQKSPAKARHVAFWQSEGFQFTGASDILSSLVTPTTEEEPSKK